MQAIFSFIAYSMNEVHMKFQGKEFVISVPYKHDCMATQYYYFRNTCWNPEQKVQLHPQRYIDMFFPRGVNKFQMRALFHAIIDSALVERGRLQALRVTSKHVDLWKTAPKRLLDWAMQIWCEFTLNVIGNNNAKKCWKKDIMTNCIDRCPCKQWLWKCSYRYIVPHLVCMTLLCLCSG